MPSLPTLHPAPRSVRIAGAVVAVQGLGGLAFAVSVLVRAHSAATGASNAYGQAGYYAVLAAAVLAVAAGLLLGRRWSRTPAAVLQLLLIAVAWYAIGPSGLAPIAIVVAAASVGTLVLLFTQPARVWAIGDQARARD